MSAATSPPPGSPKRATPEATGHTAARVVDLLATPGVPCPCGSASRAFADVPGAACSVHRVVISANAATHYHRDHAEAYYVLELDGRGEIELDGERRPVAVGTAVLIPPGVRHRAVVGPGGRMVILNVVTPPFDPADEHFD